eukprot:2358983-Pleurochrysis_carterae.AAC.4
MPIVKKECTGSARSSSAERSQGGVYCLANVHLRLRALAASGWSNQDDVLPRRRLKPPLDLREQVDSADSLQGLHRAGLADPRRKRDDRSCAPTRRRADACDVICGGITFIQMQPATVTVPYIELESGTYFPRSLRRCRGVVRAGAVRGAVQQCSAQLAS